MILNCRIEMAVKGARDDRLIAGCHSTIDDTVIVKQTYLCRIPPAQMRNKNEDS